ncbi:glycine zipper domain-containing protein [Vibrio cholerae]
MDTAEEYVQVRPWQALGMVAGAAFLLGVIVGRN